MKIGENFDVHTLKKKWLKIYEIFVSMCTIILFGCIWFISVLNLYYYEKNHNNNIYIQKQHRCIIYKI
jgi:hypothetical protein